MKDFPLGAAFGLLLVPLPRKGQALTKIDIIPTDIVGHQTNRNHKPGIVLVCIR
jgi:hypothetical protein